MKCYTKIFSHRNLETLNDLVDEWVMELEVDFGKEAKDIKTSLAVSHFENGTISQYAISVTVSLA